LVVRSTGHDFAGKGIGAGALSLWTHNLNDLEFYPNYSYESYSGPAFKLGAGVMTEDVYALAEENGVTAVGGECRVCGNVNKIPGLFKLTQLYRLSLLQEATLLVVDILQCPVW
jgi:hypothetical protein